MPLGFTVAAYYFNLNVLFGWFLFSCLSEKLHVVCLCVGH